VDVKAGLVGSDRIMTRSRSSASSPRPTCPEYTTNLRSAEAFDTIHRQLFDAVSVLFEIEDRVSIVAMSLL
jgi:hypothetical protein